MNRGTGGKQAGEKKGLGRTILAGLLHLGVQFIPVRSTHSPYPRCAGPFSEVWAPGWVGVGELASKLLKSRNPNYPLPFVVPAPGRAVVSYRCIYVTSQYFLLPFTVPHAWLATLY